MSKKKRKQETNEKWLFCHSNGKIYTLTQLFKKRIVKVMVRSVVDEHATFHIYEFWNSKQNTSSGWRLRDPAAVLKAIELAKKYEVKMYGSASYRPGE